MRCLYLIVSGSCVTSRCVFRQNLPRLEEEAEDPFDAEKPHEEFIARRGQMGRRIQRILSLS